MSNFPKRFFFKATAYFLAVAFFILQVIPAQAQIYRFEDDITRKDKAVFTQEKDTKLLLNAQTSLEKENTLSKCKDILEERDCLNNTVSGLAGAGCPLDEIIRISLASVNTNLAGVVIALRKCGFEVNDIAFTLGDLGYSKEDVEKVLPVKIGAWGNKKCLSVSQAQATAASSIAASAQVPASPSTTNQNTTLSVNNLSASEPSSSEGNGAIILIITPFNPFGGWRINPEDEWRFDPQESLRDFEDFSPRNRYAISGETLSQAASGKKNTSSSEALKLLSENNNVDANTASSLKKQGYSIKEIVFAYIDKAVGWVKEKTVEIINCAVEAIAGFFGLSGKNADKTDIALTAIYKDILINGDIKIKDGQVQTSMLAIQETAADYGIKLNAYNINKEEDISNLTQPAIAHIDGNHWVVLAKVSDNSVNIIDNGESVNLSLDEFKSRISGNVLTCEKISCAKELSMQEAKEISGSKGFKKRLKELGHKIRESCREFADSSLGKAFILIAITVLTAGLAEAIAPVLGGFTGLGSTMIKALSYGVSSFVTSFGSCRLSGMKMKDSLKTAIIAAVTAAVCAGVGEKLETAKQGANTQANTSAANTSASAAADSTGNTISSSAGESAVNQGAVHETAKEAAKENLTQTTIKAAEKAAVSYAAEETLKATGNDDNPYARVLASAAVGAAVSGIDSKSLAQGAVTSAAMQAVTETGKANNWDSTITQVTSITAGTMANAAADTKNSFSENMRQSKGALARGVIVSAVERAAEEKGLDPYTSEALSTVSGSIAANTISDKENKSKNILWESAKYAAVNTGLIAISNETKLSPAEDAIIQNSATALLNGENLSDSTQKSLIRAINFGEATAPATSYDKAVYLNKIDNFGKRVSGGEKAADVSAESITASFRQGAVEDILTKIESLKEQFSNIPKDQAAELELGEFCQRFPECEALIKNISENFSGDIELTQITNINDSRVNTRLVITLGDISVTVIKEEFDYTPAIPITQPQEVQLSQGDNISGYDDYADNFLEEQSESAFNSAKNIGEGFAERFQNAGYKGNTPESLGEVRSYTELANFLDKNVGSKISETGDIQAGYVSDILFGFGSAGVSMAANYVFEIKANAFIAQTMFEGATETMRVGSEINLICQDVKEADKAYSQGNISEGDKCVGRAMASLTREVSRAGTMLGLVQSVGKGISSKIGIISVEKEVVKDSVQTYYKGVKPGTYFDNSDVLEKGFTAKHPDMANTPDNMVRHILEESDSPYVSVTTSKKIAADKFSILKGPEGKGQFIMKGKVYKIKPPENIVIDPKKHIEKARIYKQEQIMDAREQTTENAERLIYQKIKPEDIERLK